MGQRGEGNLARQVSVSPDASRTLFRGPPDCPVKSRPPSTHWTGGTLGIHVAESPAPAHSDHWPDQVRIRLLGLKAWALTSVKTHPLAKTRLFPNSA